MGTLSDENARRIGVYGPVAAGTLAADLVRRRGIYVENLAGAVTPPGQGGLSDENAKRIGIDPTSFGSSGGGLHDGDPVSSWLDSSNNGHTGTQSGAARPTFKTVGGPNNKPFVKFLSASGQSLQLATPVSSVTPWTVLAVMRKPSAGANAAGLIGPTVAATCYAPVMGGTDVFLSDRINYAQTSAAGLGNVNFYILSVMVAPGPIYSVFINGTSVTGTGGANANSDDFTQLSRNDADTDLAELFIYNSNLSSVNRANLEAYLSAAYAIAVTSGGSPVDPSTVAGLLGWWKAGSLL